MVSKPDDHEVARACSVAASPIPAVLVKLGPLVTDRIADLRPYLDSVPDPRSRHGRWYSLTAILLVCACGVVSGANSIDKLAEWGQRASTALLTVIGIRVHALRWRRAPSSATMAGSWGLLTVTPWTGRCAPVRGSRSRRASFLWPGEPTRSRACLRGGRTASSRWVRPGQAAICTSSQHSGGHSHRRTRVCVRSARQPPAARRSARTAHLWRSVAVGSG